MTAARLLFRLFSGVSWLALLFLFPVVATGQPDRRFEQMTTNYFEEFLALHPSIATSLGDDRYNDRLENTISGSYRNSACSLYSRYLDSLKNVDPGKLSARNKLSHDIFHYDLAMLLESLRYESYLAPVDQFRDYRLNFTQLGSGTGSHPFNTIKDYDDFLHRIDDFVAVNDTAITNMRLGITLKRVQPRIIMEKVIPQLKAMITGTVSQSAFYYPVSHFPASFSAGDRERLTMQYAVAIRDKITPAFRKLLHFIEQEYMPRTRNSVGLLDVPGGQEEYAYLVNAWTTTDLTPGQIFAIGMAEVKRIEKAIEKIKSQAGFTGSNKAFFNYVMSDQRFFPFRSDSEVVEGFRKIYNEVQPFIPGLFSVTPKAKLQIAPVEKYRAATTSASYSKGTADGSRPAVFYFPVVDATSYPYWRMQALFLHEGIPGHHYQLSLQVENPFLPAFQKIGRYGAYVEGWGLYAESLGNELGLYTDPFQQLGRLQWEMHRAIRLVVDVGLHSKGWTREQAIKFSLDHEAVTREEAGQEIDRYIVQPGQALSYKIGELKMMQLRAKAQKVMGKHFDIRAFHDEILKDGAMPLQIFEDKMRRWIDRNPGQDADH